MQSCATRSLPLWRSAAQCGAVPIEHLETPELVSTVSSYSHGVVTPVALMPLTNLVSWVQHQIVQSNCTICDVPNDTKSLRNRRQELHQQLQY